MNFPNFLSITRILLIIPIILLLEQETSISYYLALLIFVIASLTDFLDGFIARKNNQSTSLGALIDLLADKLLVCLVLLWILKLNPILSFAIPISIIISRELVISSVRQFISENKKSIVLNVSFIGKTKTFLQLISIGCLIVSPNFSQQFLIFSLAIFWISSFLSLHSLLDYLRRWS